jgi:hypothetical protein
MSKVSLHTINALHNWHHNNVPRNVNFGGLLGIVEDSLVENLVDQEAARKRCEDYLGLEPGKYNISFDNLVGMAISEAECRGKSALNAQKLQEQFGAQGPAVFVIDANGPDTCEEAIKLFLGAHRGFYTAKHIVEMLKTIYSSRWTRGCVLRELTRLSNTKKIYRAIRPGQCSVYRAIEEQH